MGLGMEPGFGVELRGGDGAKDVGVGRARSGAELKGVSLHCPLAPPVPWGG